MKKLDLDFAGWLWAINANKVDEYYSDNYGTPYFKFTSDIGGCIVNQFFIDSPALLSIAYRNLSVDWSLILLTNYPELLASGCMTHKASLSFHDITWLLFKSLAHSLETKVIYELIDGDWRAHWKELDRKYCMGRKDEQFI